MKNYPLVSVYTCVYNGERTIHRVFQSLKKLDYPNIEHIIVNDGSSDRTDELVQEYIRQVPFTVKYHKKENGGKHTAMNVVWDLAEGEFLIQLDADDELLPSAVKFLVDTYYQIPDDIRHEYWCVHGRYINQKGGFEGDKYPENINQEHWSVSGPKAQKYGGDKLGLQRRACLSGYRFPEVVGVSHVPESIIWHQVNRLYGTWYTNEILGVRYIDEGGNLTAKLTTRRQFGPRAYYRKWQIMHEEEYGKSFQTILIYSLFYHIADKRYRTHNGYLEGINRHRVLLILLRPFAAVCAAAVRVLKQIR